MTSFEFAFSLFGLLLGLSLASVLSGFARVLRARHKLRLGWATPLLGLLLIIDLVTFWSNAWDMRDAIPPNFAALLYGTAIASVYFLSASLVFPEELDEWPDLDAYFMRHKGQVLIGVMAANLLVLGARVILYGNIFTSWQSVAVPIVYTGIGILIVRSREKWFSLALIAALLAMYPVLRFLF
ncbi:MAG: hypothetical protein EOP62_11170 [Sphingomonadales bacterium]|nr:MAG: hypothetical protein EOP62_11170 [Sphingomonadales bacterium]